MVPLPPLPKGKMGRPPRLLRRDVVGHQKTSFFGHLPV
jgi:hypothetical protein